MDNYGFIMFVISMSIIGFLLLREVVCWYFKINEKLAILNRIELNLRIKQNRSANKKDC